jgi:Protein of unknown function (DUF3311)
MSTPTPPGSREGLRFRAWNLLLLLPFLMLVTPWFNRRDPQFAGMPFFYWIQFVWVFVGVAAVAVVYLRTRDEDDPIAPDETGTVDELDEGAAR